MQVFCKIWHTDSAWLKLKFYVDNFLNDKEKSDKPTQYKVLNDFYRKITDRNSSVDLLRGFTIFACEVFPEEPELVLTLWGLSAMAEAEKFTDEHRLLCQQLEEAGATVISFDKIEQLKK